MRTKSKFILIFSLESIANCGDQMLGDTTEYLIGLNDNLAVKRVQFMPNDDEFRLKYKIRSKISHKVFTLSDFCCGNLKYRIRNFGYNIKYKKYYKEQIQFAEKVIFSIGMLKYSTQNFSYVFHIINKIANKKNIPVLMSAMSVETPSREDWRYQQLVRAVNYPCVKMITTRDGQFGLERLRKHYIKSNTIISDYVGDPALWAPECYNIHKKDGHEKIRLGIGLIRPNIYEDYKGGISRKELIDIYKKFVSSVIDSNEFDFYLFCNGMKEDYQLGLQLVRELNLPESKLIKRPTSAKELVELVSDFDIVFGARLHSCITSFALDIPVSGLLWDNKLDFFSESMGIREFFNDFDDLRNNRIVDNLRKAYELHQICPLKEIYKQKTKQYIDFFVDTHYSQI